MDRPIDSIVVRRRRLRRGATLLLVAALGVILESWWRLTSIVLRPEADVDTLPS